jgi:predicted aldo/keto reductase-like oxidoreductase
MVKSTLRYVLSQDVSTVVPGLKSVSEVETATKVGEQYKELSVEEQERFNFNLGRDQCRDCGQYRACSQNINIAAILRFHTLYLVYGFRVWAKKLYDGLEVKADKCAEFGECQLKCLYQLPVASMLRMTKLDFQ